MTGRYRYSFTGPGRLSPDGLLVAREAVRGLLLPAEFTTGACSGWDMACAEAALELWPDALHRIVVPAAPHDWETLHRLARRYGPFRDLRVVRLDSLGSVRSNADEYRERNRVLVAHADALIAGLRHGLDRRYRSGEWMTVNIARRAGVPVEAHDLSLAVPS